MVVVSGGSVVVLHAAISGLKISISRLPPQRFLAFLKFGLLTTSFSNSLLLPLLI
ncbi:hypothetical protein HanRHA438_Chr09g0387781 [Helianthus annuus]|nr:hypothetical protein HanRHA438_Chr09g0387781 [Helianthus annuus]